MEQIEIGLIGGPVLPIMEGLPKRFTNLKLYNATCFHIEVADGEFILFQNIVAGPFSCWYTEYMFKSAKRMYCRMKSNGVEIHSMLEGAAMFDLGKQHMWFRETAGSHNILVNAPVYTVTAFTAVPVMTFDIHISKDYFRALMEQYSTFKKLMPAMQSNSMGVLFSSTKQESFKARMHISQIIQDFRGKKINERKIQEELMNHCKEIISTFSTPNDTELIGYDISQEDIDTLLKISKFIVDNYDGPQVISEVKLKFKMSPDKLIKNFKILFKKSPKEYLIEERVRRAKAFIQDHPSAPIHDIAVSVGYNDHKHFKKVFQKYADCSIDEYRSIYLGLHID